MTDSSQTSIMLDATVDGRIVFVKSLTKKPGICAGFFSHLFFLFFDSDDFEIRSSSFKSSAVSSSLGFEGRLGKGITSDNGFVLPYYKSAPYVFLTRNCCISAASIFSQAWSPP
jgi:hypothetical protein